MATGNNTNMSSQQSIPTRRITINDAAEMPAVYSSTPGGSIFSTTPGGF